VFEAKNDELGSLLISVELWLEKLCGVYNPATDWRKMATTFKPALVDSAKLKFRDIIVIQPDASYAE